MRLEAKAILALLLPVLAACGEGTARQKQPSAQPRAVVVEVVRFAPRAPERSLVGVIRPRVETDMGFRVAGKVAERLVQQGERVKAGQPLFRLDPADLNLQREQAAAELAAARASLASSAAQDQRSGELKKSGWVSQANLDQQLARTADARGRMERAERAMALAENQAAYAEIRSDVDGIVTATMAEPGQVVAAGAPVVRVARSSGFDAVVAVPELLVDSVRGGRAGVTLWSRPGTTYPATLREFAASADAVTRTFQARFAVSAPEETLAIGMTATVTVVEPDAGKIARLPVSALYSNGRGASLFVVDPADGGLDLRRVTVAGYEGAHVLVTEGINDGEQVVAFGVQKLDPSQKVRVIEKRG
ncbi:MAG TPA: efflux RND transporter periplasmic adaptor subunit [Beijerinckiaceae bacterium]|nr:efflux RND transporter periplasmic adaptor subunit [Beijerinckiaceae bacterium]